MGCVGGDFAVNSNEVASKMQKTDRCAADDGGIATSGLARACRF